MAVSAGATALALDLLSTCQMPERLLQTNAEFIASSVWVGFSFEPLLCRLCQRVVEMCGGNFHANSLMPLHGQPTIVEDPTLVLRMETCAHILSPLYSRWVEELPGPGRREMAQLLWQEMSRPDVFSALLLVRQTKGSMPQECVQLPRIADLLSAFQEPHAKRISTRPGRPTDASPALDSPTGAAASANTPKPRRKKPTTTLTVGARAIAKHCGRSGTAWWGRGHGASSGPEPVRNAYALGKVVHILSDAVWLNLHVVPSARDSNVAAVATAPHAEAATASPQAAPNPKSSVSVSVLEVRCTSGHGARWYVPASVITPTTSGAADTQHGELTPPDPPKADYPAANSTARFWELLQDGAHPLSVAAVAGLAAHSAQTSIQGVLRRVTGGGGSLGVPPPSTGIQFRGFLEPTGAGGSHATGWKS